MAIPFGQMGEDVVSLRGQRATKENLVQIAEAAEKLANQHGYYFHSMMHEVFLFKRIRD